MTLTRRFHDIQSGETLDIEVDNDWILANKNKEIELSVTSTNVLLNGSITLSVQLYSPPLLNNTRNLLTDNITIKLQVGDVTQDVNLVNGQFSDTVVFEMVGVFTIRCLSHYSNVIEITVS